MRPNSFQFASFLLLFIFIFSSCKEKATYAPERIKSELLPVSRNVQEDSTISNFILPYKKKIKAEMDSVLAHAPKSYSKSDGPYNTAIGNMMADAVFEMANPIFQKRAGYPFNAVLLNHGGIRATLNQGPVTTRTAYELMPFENEVVVVELSGKQMRKMFDYLQSGTAHPFSGLKIELGPNGELENTTIQGAEIIDTETYFIATSDYLMNGGDNMSFFSQPISVLNLDYKIRNVLIDYFKKYDTIAPVRDDRFIKKSK